MATDKTIPEREAPARRPRLPTELRRFNAVLWREIKRAPDGLTLGKTAATVAEAA
jgi:hypothetical protein